MDLTPVLLCPEVVRTPTGLGIPVAPWSLRQRATKRAVDIVLSALGLAITSPILLTAIILARLDTGDTGIFKQTRVGRAGRIFTVYKIRTMRAVPGLASTVTTVHDPRITRVGRIFRRTNIDELPQLWNVLRGDMSFVGPRPDVPGFADLLQGDDQVILSVRPGLTGPATLRFRDEAALLGSVSDPESFNRDVVFPEKVRLNREYIQRQSLAYDLQMIFRTLIGSRSPSSSAKMRRHDGP